MSDPYPNVAFFRDGSNQNNFVGHPFVLDYQRASILTSDAWKQQAQGLPQGCFLLAFYQNDADQAVDEALLLRVIRSTKLPTDNTVISSMIEHYKDDVDSPDNKIDEFTRHEFSFLGLECRVLGSFYRIEGSNQIEFGADVENFYSATNYRVYKPTGAVLQHIVNQREQTVADRSGSSEFKIGQVRYSSSRRFQAIQSSVDVYISSNDFIGKRTALFGMTRTGKSNTIKKIIEATMEVSPQQLVSETPAPTPTDQSPNSDTGQPTFAVGQIIFDVNGEYANPNLQDEGTAIYELYRNDVVRYSFIKKPGFEEMKVNFYEDIQAGFELIKSHFDGNQSDYFKAFLAIEFEKPDDYNDNFSTKTNYDRLVAAYRCCLYLAGFKLPLTMKKLRFQGRKDINQQIKLAEFPPAGLDITKAVEFFRALWNSSVEKEINNEELKALLTVLTRSKTPGSSSYISGYTKLKDSSLQDLHTDSPQTSFESDIPRYLRQGKIVIVDLSQGRPETQQLFSEKICRRIFNLAMARFTANKNNNFIQFYFEEAHNLFPKKDDRDLSQIYNRIAKEGAKLNIGMIYATQEVSSISSNILKNTQNWFIAHLNNQDELTELKKYYDFADFTESLISFSSRSDKGFVRMKTYTNPFVVPVQIDRFLADR